MRRAAVLAADRALRAYDAVHLASAVSTAALLPALVVIAWDDALLTASAAEGLATAPSGATQ